MAEPQTYFEHLAGAYNLLKGDPGHRRQVADKLLVFLENEEGYTSFETPVAVETVTEIHEIAPVDETDVEEES